MQSYIDLRAWQHGLELVKDIYTLTQKFPREELYGLTSQVRRSSTSIIANIAEGFGRYSYPDKANKYTIARGECTETEAFIWIALTLNFCTKQEAETLIEKIQQTGRLISGLINSCRKRS